MRLHIDGTHNKIKFSKLVTASELDVTATKPDDTFTEHELPQHKRLQERIDNNTGGYCSPFVSAPYTCVCIALGILFTSAMLTFLVQRYAHRL